ncbi:ABC-type Co2+ transport system, permease component [Gottschalkia purinilytica]|uniref:ABC-type Co2+ transport system, permease component n=1 Tax=Gottschalkia purinilytica TaxID=1503 RepID=A0A0L0W8C2_GOTPU|nr:cobalt transporter CbiM [Gottschalkia purinilytica]KNF07697.1 ABC-type Co2+ transport system, permease component [Gottschalkia purinilytica]
MHILDNYLSPSTCVTLYTATVVILRRATIKIKNEVSKKKLPLLGVCSAFSFLIMMFNVPLPGGTTGHAIGGTIIAILIGPYAATVALTVVLTIQAFLFGDGGILALGANVFNMAIVIPFVGYYLFNKIKGDNHKRNYLAAFIAAYVAANISALVTAVELGLQPLLFKSASGLPTYFPYSLKITIPSMVIPHLLFAGALEGIITAGVYIFVKKTSPDIIYEGDNKDKEIRTSPLYGLLLSMILLSPLGLLASGSVWGEWSSEEINKLIGYIPNGIKNGFQHSALLPDYTISKLSEPISYVISAILGVIIVIIATKFINKGILIYKNRQQNGMDV